MLPPRIYSIFGCLFVAFCVTKNDAALALAPPPQAAGAGYGRLVFDEEFNRPPDIGYGTPGHKWNAGLWWETVPDAKQFGVSQGILTITAKPDADVALCTQYHDYSGGTYFQGGYFEAMMKCTDWSSFWLFSAQRPWQPVVASNPSTWTSELDIIETDPGAPYVHDVVTTLHKNSGGDGGVPDEQNWNNNNTIAGSPINQWHVYGCLWTQTQVTWYVDNIQVCTFPAYPSTWQPMQLILGAAPGGVNGSGSVQRPPTTAVDWVRVWH